MRQPVPFRMHYQGATGVICVFGDVEQRHVDQLASRLRVLVAERDLMVDLTGVTYLPSIAMSALIRARIQARSAGTSMLLSAADGSVASQVLQIMGLRDDTGA